MPPALVTTKLRAPRTRPNLVERPRLREVLSAHEGRALTLVSAPAGFGKTTLLGEWSEQLSRNGTPVAWLSLEDSDNDPARFLAYLVGALRTAGTGIDEEGVLASLRSPEPPPVETVVGALVNYLAEVPQGVTMVLDDYHLIDSEGVHGVVSFLIEHLPENTQLVISSRTDPPLSLAKLRARNQLIELRAAELRFTTEEASAFLKCAMGLALSEREVAMLKEVTEGWVAALQLAALSMRDREEVSGFVEAFSGSNRHVLDFLAEEVLEHQPEEVREFLLETSVLERMSAPLCKALTGGDDGQEMLERLERENLFVVALDEERRWYRYHHLFADFLRGHLTRERPERLAPLHLRASEWYEENGWVAEAIDHALSAPDHGRAARMIEQGVKGAWSRGEGPTVLRWVEALPTEAKRLRPRLLLEQAQALVLVGRPDDAEPFLEDAERAAIEACVDEEDRRFLLGYASAIRSWHARLLGDAPEAVELARRALALLPDEEAHLRNFAAVCLGDVLRSTGDLTAASAALAEAVEIGRNAGHAYGALTAMAWQARVQTERGRLREAESTLREARRFVTEQGIQMLPAAGAIHIGTGVLLYERNELEGAERELESGIELAEWAREVSNLVWGYVALSKAKRARGDEGGALETALEAERVARNAGATMQTAIAAAWLTRLRISQGDLASALAPEYVANAENAADPVRVVDRISSARLLAATGQHRDALLLLEEPLESAERAGRTGDLIEILALQALALWARGKKEQAVSTLIRALVLAEPEGYIRTFVDERAAAMADILSATLEARQSGSLDAAGQVSRRYLAKLLASIAQESAEPATDERFAEPLSERELEVLALIAAGNSNEQIAGKLFVSMSTVKTHINNLYRKLGARSRTHAIARARERDLL